MPQYAIINWSANMNYWLMEMTNLYWWPAWSVMFFIAASIGMAPLKSHFDMPFYQLVFIFIRKALIYLSFVMIFIPFMTLYLYDVTMMNQLADSQTEWLRWFVNLAVNNWVIPLLSLLTGFTIRFLFLRYVLPAWSHILREMRNKQTDDELSDIRNEAERFQVKDFLPSNHYKRDRMLVGFGENNKPIYIPDSTWYETNMQIIGPTRYGKGVILGALMDQIIRKDDCLFYIDPKKDKFAPHIMYKAAKDAGRKFYYITLHDDGIGKWAPFSGGNERDALARIKSAFSLEFTGDPGTDFYKGQETEELLKAFNQSRGLEQLQNILRNSEAKRLNAELAEWTEINSLCPKKGKGFSIERAIKENAVVYLQGSLDDSVIKTATKTFIAEVIQEARRLKDSRTKHLTLAIDEVSFLASKILAQSLATAVGFRVNFCLLYQSQNDLLNIDDKNVNARYVHQSINVNSQIKAVYGGADFDTAEWAANLSGTVVKSVARMEKTDVSGVGGETWEQHRTIGTQEENFISTNTVLTLPPRVCVFIQPRQLASILFTSFIPVDDEESLNNYLNSKRPVLSSEKTINTKSDEQQSVMMQIDDTDPEPSESKPVAPEPTDTKPSESKPVAPEPTDTKPSESKPVAPEPADIKPSESKPIAPEPADTKPSESKPVAPEPADTKPANSESNQKSNYQKERKKRQKEAKKERKKGQQKDTDTSGSMIFESLRPDSDLMKTLNSIDDED